MARILVSALAVRAPLGGYLATVLQWVLGARQLGHDVYLLEKPGWPHSCYDPNIGASGSDCRAGVLALSALFERFGLADRWCFVDESGRYHGLDQRRVDELFRTADAFVDLSADAFGDPSLTWAEQAQHAGCRVFVDGEPGHYQHRLAKVWREQPEHTHFDFYFTVGLNVGREASSVPTLGLRWLHTLYPVVTDLYRPSSPPADAPFTTVMTWRAHQTESFSASGYGQKDVEFQRFIDLPRRTSVVLDVAVGGGPIPLPELLAHGWKVRSAQEVSRTYDDYLDFITQSRGEFSVCKNAYVATNSGWFGDRSGVYLASGRPVVMQETGISSHLPCGLGLITVRNVDEAAAALESVNENYEAHSRAAREIAIEHLSAHVVLTRFFNDIGV